MKFLSAKYQGYVKDPNEVKRVRDERRSGEFRLKLQGNLQKRPSFGTWLIYALFNTVFWFAMWFKPFRLFGFQLFVRDRHVRAALLDRTGRFEVIFGPDQVAMLGEPPNLMGCEGAEHARQREVFTQILYGDGRNIEDEMKEVAEFTAKSLLMNARGRIDAVDDLLIPVLVATAQKIHGVPREDPHAFMTWTMRAAEQFISPFPAKEDDMRRSFESAKRLRSSHARLIHHGRSEVAEHSTLGRMLRMRDDNVRICADTPHEIGGAEFLTDDRLINMLIGFAFTLATQFLPDAHALNRVLKNRRLRHCATEFAQTGDEEGMRAMVRECFRCHPATWPWVARKVRLENGASSEFMDGIKLHHNDTVLISIPASLRDPFVWKRPWRFDEMRTAGDKQRAPDIDLAFGAGHHACMGRGIAEIVATQIFMVLFAEAGVRPTGPMVSRENTILPASLPVRFDADAPQDRQVVTTALIPLNPAHGTIKEFGERLATRTLSRLKNRLRRAPNRVVRRRCRRRAMRRAEKSVMQRVRCAVVAELDALDAREPDPIFKAITDEGGIHGFCVTIVDLTRKGVTRPYMLIELNADGPEKRAIERAQRALGDLLRPALDAAGWNGHELRNLMHNFGKQTKPRMFGDSGLGVFGLPESSVEEIEAERSLADFAEGQLDEFCKKAHGGSVAIEALESIRKAVEAKACLAPLLQKPRSKSPRFAAHDELPFRQALSKWFSGTSGPRRLILMAILAVILPSAYLTWELALGNGFTVFLVWIGLSLSLAVVLGLLLGGVGLMLWRRLRTAERTEPEDERQPFLDAYVESMAREDNGRQQQNHLAMVVERKPGFIRRITFYLSLIAIAWMNNHWFRPGWAHDIGSIRHARVFGWSGAREVLFLSSFDGSWSAYVGEFSDRATWGMSMFWSNFTGFVRTNRLVHDGARDDERFKRWVRTRQVSASIFRQRFPDMSNDRIRRNALIREGLSRVLTKSEAERWMRLFGSDPRSAPDMISPDESQTIIFKSFGQFPASACVGVRIANGMAEPFREALARLSMKPEADDPSDVPLISFGEDTVLRNRPAAVLGLSAQGLEKLGVPTDTRSVHHGQLHHFPMPFVEGMGRRTRILGDNPPAESPEVTWIDRADGHAAAQEVDAVFLIAAPLGVRKPTRERRKATEERERQGGKTSSTRALIIAREKAVEALKETLGESIEDDAIVVATQLFSEGSSRGDQADRHPKVSDLAHDMLVASFGRDTLDRRHALLGLDAGNSTSELPDTDPSNAVDEDSSSGNAESRLNEAFKGMVQEALRETRKERRRKRGLGFADGFSQPLLRGAPGVPERSPFQVAPGEFILGLPDEKNLRSPSPEVPAGWDLGSDLADIHPMPQTTWPDFGAEKPYGRDLGRDGTFMVIRQLQEKVKEFENELDEDTRRTNDYANSDAVKAIGRQRDGSPIGWPSSDAHTRGTGNRAEEAKLRFRGADPYGYDVPLGSHVRRAHPRDSMDEAHFRDETRHRHRIIRRGRPYLDETGDRKGLLFVCLNASIERQFEFVQQTWLNNPSFHGLFDEVDPLIGRGRRKFSIPSPDGRRTLELANDYVEFLGGGYFFVPGKSALRALTRPRQASETWG